MKKLTLLLIFAGVLTFQIFGQQPTVPAAPGPVKSRDFQIKKGQTLLNLPVSSSGRAVRATIKLDGKAITQFSINLSDKPDFWTFFDVSPYQGKTLTLEIGNQGGGGGRGGAPGAQANAAPAAPPELNTKALDMVFADVKYPGQDSVYKEKGRPQVHFSSQRGHINDPNGLVYYNGEYHLFYQHNPYGNGGGNQHWGHAVSKDMLHWIQLPEAIYPYMGLEGGRGDLAFSGSATWDPTNTSGFRKNGIDPLIAFYTSTGRGECIKLSYDNGRTFVEYEGNPILKRTTQGRDPKILWYAPGKHWVMVVWDGGMPKKLSNGDTVRIREHSIYTSPDMKKWTYQSGVSGFFECPDLFELPVEGQPGVSKWVMYDANGRYVLGSFDGKKFTVEQPFRDYVNGGRRAYYAAQTFNNSPDGRRVQIGWITLNFPGMPFTCGQGFPTELKLRKTYDGFRLTPTPIKEMSTLYKTNQLVQNKVVTPGNSASIAVNPDAPIHVIAEIEQGDAPVTFSILGYELRYDNEWQVTLIPPPVPGEPVPAARPAGGGQGAAPANSTTIRYVNTKPTLKIEAIRDKNILEIYVNDGELYIVTEITGTTTDKVEALVSGPAGMGFGGGGGAATAAPRKFLVKKLEVHELNSIWPKM
jgi:fructan beta-fructosidase